MNSNSAYAYLNRGIARAKLGDNKAAIEDFNQALQINPNSALTYYNRGFARADLGDKQGAIEDFQQAAKLYQEQGNRYSSEMALAEIAKLQK
ncbi:MAG: tetratricopeptide repeat protein [Gloeotrichia echinulata IR180]